MAYYREYQDEMNLTKRIASIKAYSEHLKSWVHNMISQNDVDYLLGRESQEASEGRSKRPSKYTFLDNPTKMTLWKAFGIYEANKSELME